MRPQSRDAAAYFELAAQSPVLEREEELALARAYRERGCQRSLDKLTRSMLRFVINTAVRYLRSGLPLSDLISEGMVGVLKAARKFEPERGLRFVTFASYWVRAEIGAAVQKHRSIVSAATPRPGVRARVRREMARVRSELGQSDEALDVLAQRLGLTRSELDAQLARLEIRDVSLDAVDSADNRPMIERLVDDSFNPEEHAARSRWEDDLPAAVHDALDVLDPRERFIAEARLMASPEDELTLAEVGRRLNVTRERARQLEVRTKAKLRKQLVESRPMTALAA
jgi:RNA polymerase sigma-32 factor